MTWNQESARGVKIDGQPIEAFIPGMVMGTANYFGGSALYFGQSSPDQSYAYSATKRCDYCQRKNAHDKAVCDGCGAVL